MIFIVCWVFERTTWEKCFSSPASNTGEQYSILISSKFVIRSFYGYRNLLEFVRIEFEIFMNSCDAMSSVVRIIVGVIEYANHGFEHLVQNLNFCYAYHGSSLVPSSEIERIGIRHKRVCYPSVCLALLGCGTWNATKDGLRLFWMWFFKQSSNSILFGGTFCLPIFRNWITNVEGYCLICFWNPIVRSFGTRSDRI